MKKYAWTLMEMVIAITILILLSGLCVNLFKPNVQKARFYMYAAVKNLTKGNITIIEKYDSLSAKTVVGTDDWYCINLADAFSIESAPDCSTTASDDTPNIQFPNKTTVYGLAKEWKAPYSGANFKYKNIMIDIDGPNEGLNKLWADRFPMRIITGTGRGEEGLIVPVNCANDQVYNAAQNKLVNVDSAAKNPYCGSSGKNYTIDDQVLIYNIYKANDDSENAKAHMVAGMLSHMEADCAAYGGTQGSYNVLECDSAKIKIKPQCATQDNCRTCTANTCPEGSTDMASCIEVQKRENPDDFTCFTLLNKPSGGMSFIFQAIIGDADEL